MQMIDIHSHLLPGIDDGPRDWEQSLALCEAMSADGIATAVATPHLIDGIYENLKPRVVELTEELRSRLSAVGNPLEVLPGAEVDISSRLLVEGGAGLPLLGGGSAVLIEMPVAVIPSALDDILFAVRSRGLLPVLAHPERNQLLQANPALAAKWVDAGAALQVDGDSLLGVWGRGSDRCARTLLRKGMVHALSSDAHNVDSRPPRLSEALEAACSLIGEEAVKLVTKGPAAIMSGRLPDTPLYRVDPQEAETTPTGKTAMTSRISRALRRLGRSHPR